MFKWLYKKYLGYKIRKGVEILKYVDGWIIQAGFSRQERRKFWREVAGHAKERNELLDKLGEY